jgi:TonB family protein
MDAISGNISGSESRGSIPPWSRVSFGPADAWVDEEGYDGAATPRKEGAHFTHLLWTRQVDAELGKSFHRTALRLETAIAVQNQSQWRLEFDPRTQRLTLHWLRVVRGQTVIDQLQREHMRLIQREAQLEHLVIDGHWTLLVVLLDVRPGDIIDAGYTFETRHPISAGQCEVFYYVPPQATFGNFRLSVLFDSQRPGMKWLAAPDAPQLRDETLASGRRRWLWTGDQLAPREDEPNRPSSTLDYLWVQVTDLAGWQPLIARLVSAWGDGAAEKELAVIPAFVRPARVGEAEINQLIQFIQDEFRYLSVNLENAGWIPNHPALVAQRRYGDCKDLAWLGVSVLRSWNVEVRPVLVGSGLHGRVASLLPMSILFDHAVIEVGINGRKRWFDLTLRSQGGDFSRRSVGWYEYGLPVDNSLGDLIPQSGEQPHALCAVREDIYLDTRLEKASVVVENTWYEGWQADNIRRTRASQGPDEFAQERLKHARKRFNNAARLGLLHLRDNREKNVLEISEAFEVTNAVHLSEDKKRAIFDVPANLVVQWFSIPAEKPRRCAWNMPRHLELRHALCVHAPGMGSGATLRRLWAEPEVTGSLEEPRDRGCWSKVTRFSVSAAEIPPSRIAAYRQQMIDFFTAASWRLYLPTNGPRVESPAAASAPPGLNSQVNIYVPAADVSLFPPAASMREAVKRRDGGSWWKRRRLFAPSAPSATRVGVMFLVMLVIGSVSRMLTPTVPTDASPPVNEMPVLNPDLIYLPASQEGWRQAQEINAISAGKQGVFIIDHFERLTRPIPPRPVSRTLPPYPPDLLAQNLLGTVLIGFIVDRSGHVLHPGVVTSSNHAFDQGALEAVAKWTYKPSLRAGMPVRAFLTVPIAFTQFTRSSNDPSHPEKIEHGGQVYIIGPTEQ